jgi:small subunit ribosomal protein S4
MGRDIGPKDKQSRRIGEKLFLKGARDYSPKSAIVKRPYPPGIHGPKSYGRKLSEYGKQLMAKQKIKKMYRLRERQFHKYFNLAGKMKGDASMNLLLLLEKRFDNVIYRLGLADSRDQARQLVTHGHFLINGHKVKIPSYQIKLKDKITLREKSKTNGIFSLKLKEIKQKDMPAWLDFNEQNQTATVIDEPDPQSLNLAEAATLTVEFYSR